MTISVLFIQGAGQDAHAGDRTLADSLQRALGQDYKVAFPRMPGQFEARPEAWKRSIAKEAQAVQASVIVAHAIGAAIVADLLANERTGLELPHVKAAFLLAPPYVGRGGWVRDGYHLDAHRERPPGLKVGLFFYFGAWDTVVPTSHSVLYEHIFPYAAHRRFSQCGHRFIGHMPLVAQDVDVTARAFGLLKPGRA